MMATKAEQLFNRARLAKEAKLNGNVGEFIRGVKEERDIEIKAAEAAAKIAPSAFSGLSRSKGKSKATEEYSADTSVFSNLSRAEPGNIEHEEEQEDEGVPGATSVFASLTRAEPANEDHEEAPSAAIALFSDLIRANSKSNNDTDTIEDKPQISEVLPEPDVGMATFSEDPEDVEGTAAPELVSVGLQKEQAILSGGVDLRGSGPYATKDQAKSDQATKFIGRGSAASSTAKYAKAWGNRANSGSYTAADKVFVSAEGSRGGRVGPDFAELSKALGAGATIITDVAMTRNQDYNVGERQVTDYLTENGYAEVKPGTWTPAPVSLAEMDTSKAATLKADGSDDVDFSAENDESDKTTAELAEQGADSDCIEAKSTQEQIHSTNSATPTVQVGASAEIKSFEKVVPMSPISVVAPLTGAAAQAERFAQLSRLSRERRNANNKNADKIESESDYQARTRAQAVVKPVVQEVEWDQPTIPAGSKYSVQEWLAASENGTKLVFEVRNAGQSALICLPMAPKGAQKATPGTLHPLFVDTFNGCLLLAPSATTSHPGAISGEMVHRTGNKEFGEMTYRIVRPESQREKLFYLFDVKGSFDTPALGLKCDQATAEQAIEESRAQSILFNQKSSELLAPDAADDIELAQPERARG